MIDNCADDWRIAMTWQRMMMIVVEVVICAVHPIPGRYYFLWTTKLSNHGGKIGSQWVPVDVTLSLPMFFRLYLICRFVYVHYVERNFKLQQPDYERLPISSLVKEEGKNLHS